MTIHGSHHMAKAKRLITTLLPKVDVVIELREMHGFPLRAVIRSSMKSSEIHHASLC